MFLNVAMLAALAPFEVTAAALRQPIATDIIVPEEEWDGFDSCPDVHCKCRNPQAFSIRMCKSFTCTACVEEFCTTTCQDLQRQYPTCRCPDWPESRKSYSDASSVDVEPQGPVQLVHYGKNMEELPAGQTKLGECEGDCDNGDDCQPGLYCYQKDTSDDVPPGCTAGGEGDRMKADYCVKPSHAPGELVDYGNSGQNKPNGQLKLGECEGDCDNDGDCQPGLYCYQRKTSDNVPTGCTAGGKGDVGSHDYCVKSSK